MCMFCRSLFVLLCFFFSPLCCLLFFDIRILITLLVSLNTSYLFSILSNILFFWTRSRFTAFSTSSSATGYDRMVVGFTTTYAISAYHHWCCEFQSRSGRGVQHYVIKFVSDLRQVGDFLRVLWFPPPIKLTATI
jgi:hypothetical protein